MAYQGLLTSACRWMAVLAVIGGLGTASVAAQSLEFNVYRRGGAAGNTVLVVGGIQGDEPGGFNAAALILTHYEITRGNVWVVPNLNFPSIIKRSRGVHGDLNRKFDRLPPEDPEYRTIQRIKAIISHRDVDLVLNLHDGSGFYRDRHIDRLHNPDRWGQSVIIDASRITGGLMSDLQSTAAAVVHRANGQLMDREHVFSVKNTETPMGNVEMAKTLTYFAVRSGKPAYGLEVSKSFPTHLRAYYHLCLVEAFFDRAGIGYRRRIPLQPEAVRDAIDRNVRLSFHDHRVVLTADNARSHLKYFPLKKGDTLDYMASNPLVAVIADDDVLSIQYGNRRLVRVTPSYYDYDDGLEGIRLTVDGRPVYAGFGEIVDVRDDFAVDTIPGYRVNVIGYTRNGDGDETGVVIRRNHIHERFSMDRSGWIYRVEVYRDPKFAGMVLVNFDPTASTSAMEMGFPGTAAVAPDRDDPAKRLAVVFPNQNALIR